MQPEPTQHTPLLVVSRSASSARINKLRVSWFILGMAFGIGCMSASGPTSFHWSFSLPKWQISSIATPKPLPEPKSLEEIVGAGPPDDPDVVVKTEHVVALPLNMTLTIPSGSNLSTALTRAGIPQDDAHSIVEAIGTTYDVKKFDAGQTVEISFSKNPDSNGKPMVESMSLPLSAASSLEINRAENGSFVAKTESTAVEKKLTHIGGHINSSLYQTAIDSGLPPGLIDDMITAYSYDVDFQREIKEGNSIDVLYERLETENGSVAGFGNIMYAKLDLTDRELKIYRYVDHSGHADFYNERGESIRKALLRTPINGARITSGFGMRNHPILGYSKMHRGVDFAAVTGTPIYASGDGTVAEAGKKGGYGNYIRIKHNDKYASAYGHLSRFAAGMTPGHKVKQGEIIGYVGATGMATGPHLHYEILVNNEQVNPANVKFKTGNILQGKELLAFKANVQHMEAKLAETNIQPRKVTLAEKSPNS